MIAAAAMPAVAAEPEPAAPVRLALDYIVDAVGVDAGRSGHGRYLLDNLNVTADFDMDHLLGWRGGAAHVHLLNNLGSNPNDRAATLQGIDNIEVGQQRLRLFEAWIEQGLGARASARLGLYDLNSEFYSNDAAKTLLAPAFGVGSEIAATGTNGPSIFPSTALALRLATMIGRQGYARAAIINAEARTIGDPHGIDTTFRQGGLLIGEVGTGSASKIGVGAWAYTRAQNDLQAVDASGRPLRRAAHGGYVIVQHPLGAQDGAWATQAFARIGLSEGRTTPFRGGWQAGFLFARPIAGRPDSVLSLGANQAYLAPAYRRALVAGGVPAAAAESAIEITYADTVLPHVTLQPDLQLITHPAGARDRDTALALTLRLGVHY
jgi:porin